MKDIDFEETISLMARLEAIQLLLIVVADLNIKCSRSMLSVTRLTRVRR